MFQNSKKKCSVLIYNYIHMYWKVYLCIWKSSYVIKDWFFNVRLKKWFKAAWRSHWFQFKSKIHPVAFASCSRKHLYKKIRTWTFWFFGLICSVRHLCPTGNTGRHQNRNYELRALFCNSAICGKNTNNWCFHIEYRSYEHDK